MSAIDDCRELGLLPEEVVAYLSETSYWSRSQEDDDALESLAAALLEQKARADEAERVNDQWEVEIARVMGERNEAERDRDHCLDLLQAAYDEAGRPRPHDQKFDDWCNELARRTTPSQSGGE